MMFPTKIARLVLSLCIASGTISAQGVSRQNTGPKPAAQPEVLIASSPGFAQTPAAPQVICSGGEVTVSAENATLSSVLKAVAGCAGAIVHMPAAIGATRVMVRYGPVAPMMLFASLLDGSADYVILGSTRSSARVQMVIVKPHQAFANSAQPAAGVNALAVEKTFIDEEGVERLPSGLTAEEATLTPEELAQRFEAARQEQQRLDELTKHPD